MKYLDRLKIFPQLGLGLSRSTVSLSPSNPDWPKAFKIEKEILEKNLEIESLQIHHMGSTSIPGLAAKPIVDILAGVESLQDVDAKKSVLENIGYEFKGEYGIPGRRYCTLYSEDKKTAYVHLHIFETKSYEFYKHLVFVHYLKESKQALSEYEQHKLSLVNDQKIQRANYSDAKNAVIQKLQREAEELWPFSLGISAFHH